MAFSSQTWDGIIIFVTNPSDVIFVWFYHRETSNLKDSARDADDDDDEDDDEEEDDSYLQMTVEKWNRVSESGNLKD